MDESSHEHDSCKDCDPGLFQDGNGKSSCKSCSPGQKASGYGNTGCSDCAKGKFQSAYAQGSCSPCLAGTVQPSTGQSSCNNCGTGQFQNSDQQQECKNCGTGQYTDQTTQSECKDCEKGFYQSEKGKDGCTACATGQFQSSIGQGGCDDCGRGSYSDEEGKKACDQCPVGRYGASKGLNSNLCTGPCKKGYHCPLESTSSTQRDCPVAYTPPVADGVRAKFYCEEGQGRKTVSANYYTLPQGSASLDHRESQLVCPSDYYCTDGIAKPKLSWNEGTGCNPEIVGVVETVQLEIQEDKSATAPSAWEFPASAPGFGGGAVITYSITLFPDGCSGNPSTTTQNAMFQVGSSNAVLQVSGSTTLDAESCTDKYYLQIEAKATEGTSVATTRCNLAVTVGDINEAPVVTFGQVRHIEEESPVNTPIGDPIQASDPEADIGKQELLWSIQSCTNNGQIVNPCPMKIAACGGQLSVEVSNGLDTDVLDKDWFDLVVKATDDDESNPLSNTASVRVFIDPVNEPPMIKAENNTFLVPEDQSVNSYLTQKIVAFDPEGDKISYIFTGSPGLFPFDVNSSSGQLKLLSQLDFENGNLQYYLPVKVVDEEGLEFGPVDIEVRVIDANDAPELDESNVLGQLVFKENTGATHSILFFDEDDGGTNNNVWGCCQSIEAYTLAQTPNGIARCGTAGYPTYVLSTDDHYGKWTIAANDINYERESFSLPCAFGVRVTDKGELTFETNIVISVEDLNDPPVIPSQSCTALETDFGAVAGCSIYAIDEDMPKQILSWRKGAGGTGNAYLDIAGIGDNNCTIKIVQALDYETKQTLTVNAVVSDTDGGSDTAIITLNVVDVNDAPQITNEGDYRIMLENMVGVDVPTVWSKRKSGDNQYSGADGGPTPIIASDADTKSKWNQISYSIVSPASGFSINGTTGRIQLTEPQNYEALLEQNPNSLPKAGLRVKACDNGGLCDEKDVTIHILNVDEAPVLLPMVVGETMLVKQDAGINTQVGSPLRYTDEDSYHGPSKCIIKNQTRRPNAGAGAWENADDFSINAEQCQMLVKRSLASATGYEYKIFVYAKDKSPSYCSWDGGDNGFPGYGISNCAEGAELCNELAGGGGASSCQSLDGLSSNAVMVTIDVNNDARPPSMDRGLIYYIEENSPVGSVVYGDSAITYRKPWIPCYDYISVTKENTPACKYTDCSSITTTCDSSSSYCPKLYYYQTSETINPSGTLGAKLPFTVSDVGTINVSASIDYEQLNGWDPEVRCNNSLSRTDANEDPIRGVCRIHNQEEYKTLKDSNPTPARDSVQSWFGFRSFGGSQRLCSNRGWRMANFSELQAAYTAGLNYIDTGKTNASYVWTLEGKVADIRPSGMFEVSPIPPLSSEFGVMCYVGQSNDVEKGTVGYLLTVTCSDTGSEAILDNGQVIGYKQRLADTETVFVVVKDVNENPTMADVSIDVKESASINSVIGQMVSSDEDIYSTASYSGMLGSQFSIEQSSGNISISSQLDYEAKNKYQFTVTVTDDGGLTGQATVEINIQDVNEPPSFASQPTFEIEESVARGTSVGTIQAMDEDTQDQLHFVIVDGNTNQSFGVVAISGESRKAKIVVSDEMAIDYERQQQYKLKVQVYDRESSAAAGVLSSVGEIVVDIKDVPDVTVETVSVSSLTSQLSTNGGEQIVITGTNFGFYGSAMQSPVLKVTYTNGKSPQQVFTAKNCAVSTRNTEITCTSSEGYGSDLKVTVEVSGGTSGTGSAPTTSLMSYGNPNITSIRILNGPYSPQNLKTIGGDTIQIHGHNLGPKDLPVDAQYGPAGEGFCAQSCVVKAASTMIECQTAQGTGALHRWRVGKFSHGWESALSGLSDTTSYTRPVVVGVEPTLLSTYGGETVVLTGVNFGPNETSFSGCKSREEKSETINLPNPLVEYSNGNGLRFDAKDCVMAAAHTNILCTSVIGVGTNFRWMAVVDGQSSDVSTKVTDYKPPVIESVEGPGAYGSSTSGGDAFFVRGDFFGPLGAKHINLVMYWNSGLGENFYASSCSVSQEQKAIQCFSGQGIGKNLRYQILIEGQMSNVGVFDGFYAQPSLFSVKRTPSVSLNDADTRGYTTVAGIGTGSVVQRDEIAILDGENFGPTNATWNVVTGTYGSATVQYIPRNCFVTISHVQVKCSVAPGAGRKHTWSLLIGEQQTRSPSSSYHVPVISSITGPGAKDGHTSGGQNVVLNGLNFGPYPDEVVVTYGEGSNEYSARNCRAVSHQRVECLTAPGAGQNLRWQVTVRDQSNIISPTTSYAAPYIWSAYPTESSSLGTVASGEIIYLNVTNTGLIDIQSSREISFGDHYTLTALSDPLDTRVEGHFDILAFQVPELFNGMKAVNIPIRVTVKSGPSLSSLALSNKIVWSYKPPLITQIAVRDHPSNTDVLIVTVYGKNFGSAKEGPKPSAGFRISLNRISSSGGVTAIKKELGKSMDGYVGTAESVQHWEQNSIRDKIVLVTPVRQANLTVSRGGATSAPMAYTLQTPLITSMKMIAISYPDALEREVLAFPTVGHQSKPGTNLILEIDCIHCGSLSAGILPQKTVVLIGNDISEEKDCPIIAASVEWNSVDKKGSFRCEVPSGQGSKVGVFVKYISYRSEPANIAYEKPVLTSISKTVISTKGGSIDLQGNNFGDKGKATVMQGGKPAGSTTQDGTAPHSKATAFIPPGIGGYDRAIQIKAADQLSDGVSGMAVSYAYPSIVDIVRPLWRPARGQWEYEVLGFNFDTLRRATSQTTVFIGTTEATVKPNMPQYDKISCTVPAFTLAGSNPIVIVGGLSSAYSQDGIVSDSRKAAARLAVKSGTATDDQTYIVTAMDYKNKTMLSRINTAVQAAGGLRASVLSSNYQNAEKDVKTGNATDQQKAIVAGNTRTDQEAQVARACMILNHAFQSECEGGGFSTEESRMIVFVGKQYDKNMGIEEITCAEVGSASVSRRRLSNSNNMDIAVGAVSFPSVISVQCDGDRFHLPTKGGVRISIIGSHFGAGVDSVNISLIDPTGTYPPVYVPKSDIITYHKDNDDDAKHVLTTIVFSSPEGQGTNLRVHVKTKMTELGSVPLISGADIVGFKPPTLLPVNEKGPTDGCVPGRFESALKWAARLEGVSPEQQRQNVQKYNRQCLEPHKLILEGENFGINPKAISISIHGAKPLFSNIGATSEIFIAFDGSGNNGPGFSDTSCNPNSNFCFQLSHEKLVVRGPSGYGKELTLVLNVAGQTTNTTWSFLPPTIKSGMPNPYNAKGDLLSLHGLNFGGRNSPVTVVVNDKPCSGAKWHRQHPTDGFPFVTCFAQHGVVGTANISLFVANQWSDAMPVLKSIERSVLRSVCIPSAFNVENGTRDSFWARAEPGELCSLCPFGAYCKEETYDAPVAVGGFWVAELDISAGRPKIEVTEENAKTLNSLELKEIYDFNRAAGLPAKDKRKRACPAVRLFDESLDKNVISQFPFAAKTKRDICLEVAACKPREACKGSNQCEIGYEYQRERCEERRATETNESLICNTTLQCRTRSAPSTCAVAIETVCRCPPSWKPNSVSCLKKCIRDAGKKDSLVSKGCILPDLQKALAGSHCDYRTPENCRSCVKRTNTDKNEDYGVCECDAGSERCSRCTQFKYFKINGKCEECPKNVVLVIGLFCFGVLILCVGMFVLDQQEFNLAFISIGIDYFQVLAMFTNSDIRWPMLLKRIMGVLDFFNFNVDIMAPECLLPEFDYRFKYTLTMILPFVVFVVLLLGLILHVLVRKCLNREIEKHFISRLVGTFMLSLYFMYLMLTMRALQVFNCSPTDPDDGWTYTSFTSLECAGGLCRCGDVTHLQSKLALSAIVALLAYTLGFPVWVLAIIRWPGNKKSIKIDQILRARNVTDQVVLDCSKDAHRMRVRYHKMYYHFKPGKTYWILYILLRKAGIAFAGLMFRTQPGFQMAVMLLILFVAFVLQVKHQPYMSTAQRELVLAEHKQKVKEGVALHKNINDKVKRFLDGDSNSIRGKKKKNLHLHSIQHAASSRNVKNTDAGTKRQYFFDYNTVEQVLLACAILVCLTGVMFESDRFQESDNRALVQDRYGWQRELITYVAIFIVIFSLMYYCLVLVSEIFGIAPKFLVRYFGDRQKANAPSIAMLDEGQRSDSIILSTNPIQNDTATKAKLLALQKQLNSQNQQMIELSSMNRTLVNEKRGVKKEAGKTKRGGGRGAAAKKKAGKKVFGQTTFQ